MVCIFDCARLQLDSSSDMATRTVEFSSVPLELQGGDWQPEGTLLYAYAFGGMISRYKINLVPAEM
jgi:hypothetical protein